MTVEQPYLTYRSKEFIEYRKEQVEKAKSERKEKILSDLIARAKEKKK